MLFAFFTVNCGQLPLGVTQGQVDTAISELYTGLPTGTVYYSHNHLGSGNLVTDAAGNEVFRITYDEYGQIDLQKSGKFNPATGLIEHDVEAAKILVTAVKYTGQEYDPETGLYYYNARYYDPQLGVFTTADTEFDAGAGSFGFNRHMYVAGNPIRLSDPSGHNIFDDICKWWDENTGDPIRKEIGDKAFNVLAGLASGLVPGLDMYQACKTGGLGNLALGEIGKGTTGLMNMAGCVGCYANFSYTEAEGFGFGVGWGPARGIGVNAGLMYRERGAFAGMNMAYGFGVGVGAYGNFGVNFVINMNHGNTIGMFASFGASDKNMSVGASAGFVCSSNSCSDTYSGYSAVDYGAMGIGPFNTRDLYPTSDRRGSGGRHQHIGYGADGESPTFGFDNDSWLAKITLGERGLGGFVGQIAGLKPTSVMHDYLVVSKRMLGRQDFIGKWGGRAEFVGSMLPSLLIAQPLAHTSYRVNAGYRRFTYAN